MIGGGSLFNNNSNTSSGGGGLFGGNNNNATNGGASLFGGANINNNNTAAATTGGLFSGGNNNTGQSNGMFGGNNTSGQFGNFMTGNHNDHEIKTVITSFKEAVFGNSLSTQFKMPIYHLAKERGEAQRMNSNFQVLMKNPEYSDLWGRCHRYNPNPDEYATQILFGLESVEKRQSQGKEKTQQFEKLLGELKQKISVSDKNLNATMGKKITDMKQRNSRILNRLLRVEQLLERLALQSDNYEKISSEYNRTFSFINEMQMECTDLESSISNTKYQHNHTNQTSNSSRPLKNEALVDAFAIQEPTKLDSNGYRIVDGEGEPMSDFYDGLLKIKSAIETAQSRMAKNTEDLERLAKLPSQFNN